MKRVPMGTFVTDVDQKGCAIEGCARNTAVRLAIPWAGERDVCTAHARVWAQKEGVVAMPLDGQEDEWP